MFRPNAAQNLWTYLVTNEEQWVRQLLPVLSETVDSVWRFGYRLQHLPRRLLRAKSRFRMRKI